MNEFRTSKRKTRRRCKTRPRREPRDENQAVVTDPILTDPTAGCENGLTNHRPRRTIAKSGVAGSGGRWVVIGENRDGPAGSGLRRINVEKSLFSVSCTTCRARLAVRSKSAIGQIHECPKCGSMVMILPPDGWVEVIASPTPPATPPSPGQKTVAGQSPNKTPPPRAAGVPASAGSPARTPPKGGTPASAAVVPPPVQAVAAASVPPSPPSVADELATTTVLASAGVAAPSVSQAGALTAAAPLAAAISTEGPQAIAVRLGFTPFKVPEVVAGQTYLSALTQSLLGRMTILVVSGLLGLATVYGIYKLATHRRPSEPANTADPKTDVAAVAPEPSAQTRNPPEQIDRRWLPEQTVYLLDVRPSQLARQPEVINSLASFPPRWEAEVERVHSLLLASSLQEKQVRRVTWAAADLSDVSKAYVVVLQLEPGVDSARFVPKGNEVTLGGSLIAHRQQNGGRSNLVVAADAHTIVIGSEELLRQVAARNGEAVLSSPPMELLVKKFVPAGELALLIDFSVSSTASGLAASWKPSAAWLDVWPQGKSAWRQLCDVPVALGLSVQTLAAHRCELGLVCTSETMAKNLSLTVEKLLSAANGALPEHIAALQDSAALAKVEPDAADHYRQVLDGLLASLHSYGCETSDGIVWLRLNWDGEGLPAWVATALGCDAAWKADWLAAARRLDEANQRGLLGALADYAKAQNPQRFPAAAAGGARALGPETRLSWIAEMLPFLGHGDWKPDPTNDWNSAANKPITQRPLPEAVNPALGPSAAGGYPVTHYVGAAGVGEDAAGLPAGDPRAGLFGYERQTRQQDLVRGGANTIAVLGVQDQCGPWAQGGRATTRSLTRQPYINGPDGFGSGQPNGMVAGMADGSVRFLSDNIDPHTLELMMTVGGGDKVDASMLAPQGVQPPPLFPPPPDRAKPTLVPPPAQPVVKPKAEAPLDPKLQVRLSEPIKNISLVKRPLDEAVRLVASIGALSVSFDPDAMEELGVTLHDPITIEAEDATVARCWTRSPPSATWRESLRTGKSY